MILYASCDSFQISYDDNFSLFAFHWNWWISNLLMVQIHVQVRLDLGSVWRFIENNENSKHNEHLKFLMKNKAAFKKTTSKILKIKQKFFPKNRFQVYYMHSYFETQFYVITQIKPWYSPTIWQSRGSKALSNI